MLYKKLLERRIPQILGSYLVTGTSLILFIDYLVDKYQFPPHYPTLTLFALVGILPSVVILAYFHGAPGKDEWTKIEKVGIPINVIFIAGSLFFGDSLNIWGINNQTEDSQPTVSLIHFTSLTKHIPHYKKHLTLETDNDLHPIDESLLDSLRSYFSVQLLNWYFGEKKDFIIPNDYEEIHYLDNYPLLSVDLEFTEERKKDAERWFKAADSIYYKYNNPSHIAYFNIYKVSSGMEEYKYIITESYLKGNPNRGNNGNEHPQVESISDLFDKIKDEIQNILGSSKNIGIVSEINDDIILVNIQDFNVRKGMELIGTSTYNFGPEKNGYKHRIEDLKNAIEHMQERDDGSYNADLEFYSNKYSALLGDSLYCRSYDKDGKYCCGCVQTRGQNYFLRVINVIDSVAVTKLIKFKYPWVQIRINDNVYVSTN